MGMGRYIGSGGGGGGGGGGSHVGIHKYNMCV